MRGHKGTNRNRDDEHTRYGVGSIITTVTAALVQLRDEGKLSLDGPVVKHTPELRQVRTPLARWRR